MNHERHDVTQDLLAAREGGGEALDRLFERIYPELKAMARRELRRRPGSVTLDTTSLVHEAYVKLTDQTRLEWNDRAHFFAIAARALRQIAVDHARRRFAAKRGSGIGAVPLDEGALAASAPIEQLLFVDEALQALARVSPRLVRIVELCFFAGFTTDEAAEALGVSARTVKRDWRKARALLFEMVREKR